MAAPSQNGRPIDTCLNCFEKLDADQSKCQSCGNASFSFISLLKRYEVPSRRSYNLEALLLSPDPLDTATIHFVDAAKSNPVDRAAIEANFHGFTEAATRPGWLSGIICRLVKDGEHQAADLVSHVRFHLLRSAHPDSATPEPPPASDLKLSVDQLAASICKKRLTCEQAFSALRHHSREDIVKLLQRELAQGDCRVLPNAYELARVFLLFLLAESTGPREAVIAAAEQVAYLAHSSGGPSTALAFAKITYCLLSEKAETTRAQDALANLLLAAKLYPSADSIRMLVEIYGAPPWHDSMEHRVFCSDAIVDANLVADLTAEEARNIHQLAVDADPEVFLQRTLFMSVERFMVHGRHDEARRILSFASDVAKLSGDKSYVVASNFDYAQSEKAAGRLDAARVRLQECLIYAPESDPDTLMDLLDLLTTVESEVGAIEDARRHYAKLTEIASRHSDLKRRPRILLIGGLIEMSVSNFKSASVLFRRALEIIHYAPLQNRGHIEAALRNNLAQCEAAAGKFAGGEHQPRTFGRSSALSQGHEAMDEAMHLAKHDPEAAITGFESAAEKFARAGNAPLQTTALFNAATAALNARLWGRCEGLLEQCLRVGHVIGFAPELNRERIEELLAAVKMRLGLSPPVPLDSTDDVSLEYVEKVYYYLHSLAALGELTESDAKIYTKNFGIGLLGLRKLRVESRIR